MKTRNYTIDFFRMIFIIIICIYHFQNFINVKIIESGYLCVEFFFIVSGFYLYKSFKKQKNMDNLQYTIKKVKRMYPHYIFSLLVCIFLITVNGIIKNKHEIVNTIYTFISESLMLQNIGIYKGGFNTPIWYISVLIFGGYIIYGLLKKDKDLFLRILGPIFVIFTFNLIISNSDTIENWNIIYGLYIPLLRGMADITIGCLLAEFIERYSNKIENLIDKRKLLFYIIEVLTFILLIYIIIYKTEYDLYSLILFSILILFANCKISICSKLFDKEVFKKNGDLTYAMYLNHLSICMVMSVMYDILLSKIFNNKGVIIVLYILIVIIYSYFTDKFVKYLIQKKGKNNKNKKINKSISI